MSYNNSNLTQQFTFLVYNFLIISWRIESYMFFVEEYNKIKYSYNTDFQKVSVSIHPLLSFYCVLEDFMHQIFIFIIHDWSERSHLRSWVLSIVLVYQKVIKSFFKLYFSFLWSFIRSKNFEQFYWIPSLLLGGEGL